MAFIAVLPFLLLMPLSGSNAISPGFSNYKSCAKICQCSYDEEGKVSVKCSLAGENFMKEEIQLPPEVYTL